MVFRPISGVPVGFRPRQYRHDSPGRAEAAGDVGFARFVKYRRENSCSLLSVAAGETSGEWDPWFGIRRVFSRSPGLNGGP